MPSMILSTKGASPSVRSCMRDISNMSPTVAETNFDIKKKVSVLGSYMSMNECGGIIFFECTKRAERLWLATPSVSVRFAIHDLWSVYDLCTTTNYHRNGGHVLLFSKDFDEDEHLKIARSVIEAVLPSHKDASVERAVAFFYVDGVVYVRNYIIENMAEIGPRLALQLDKILDGCIQGPTLFSRAGKQGPDA